MIAMEHHSALPVMITLNSFIENVCRHSAQCVRLCLCGFYGIHERLNVCIDIYCYKESVHVAKLLLL